MEELMFEIWKPVKGYEHKYEVSNQGRVRDITRNNRIQCQYMELDHSHTVILVDGIEKIHRPVHELMMEAFQPLDDYTGMVVHHIDEHKGHNFIENLEWIDTNVVAETETVIEESKPKAKRKSKGVK